MSANSADKLIARLPEAERLKILDAIARATQHGSTVNVEYSHQRKLDEATSVVGRVLGVAYAPGGGSSIELVVQPVAPSKRLLAIPAAHVLRVRWAHDPSGMVGTDPTAYLLGEVLAGPPAREEARA